MILSLTIAVTGQDVPGSVIPTHVARSTRPHVELARFKKLKCVSVSEYSPPWTSSTERNRVFRFTYRADYHWEAARWKKEFPKSAGWIQSTKSTGESFVVRSLDRKPVRRQFITLHSGKIKFDANDRNQISESTDGKWVWVSLIETTIKR